MNKIKGKDYSISPILYLIIMFFLFPILLSAQTDWERWEKKDMDYQISQNKAPIDSLQSASVMSFLKKSYSFFISDVDGDNCPFYPTCSSFYVQAVHRTNIFQGTLMFADRFTRDSNLFKSHTHYPHHISGRLFDPVDNYLLNDSTIIYYSREDLVK